MTDHYKKIPISFITTLLCLVGLAGCGLSADTENDFPAPGTMQVLSTMALKETPEKTNLLENGTFTEWWAGAKAPTDFTGPATDYSRLERVWANEGFLASQRWYKAETAPLPTRTFRCNTPELTANTPYQLTVTASECVGRAISLSIWKRENNKYLIQAKDIIVIPPMPMGVQTLDAVFTPKANGVYIITAQPMVQSDARASINWHQWHLEQLNDA